MNNGAKTEKKNLRRSFLEKMQRLPETRRNEAENEISETLYKKLKDYKQILSFHSMRYEISTHALNRKLAREGRLLLPKIDGDSLTSFSITNIEEDLCRIKGDYFEPNPQKAREVLEFDLILVPGLAFDRRHYRLGYGLGHYDRFLIPFCGIKKIGIAFKEQFYAEDLPIEPHDQRVDEVVLF